MTIYFCVQQGVSSVCCLHVWFAFDMLQLLNKTLKTCCKNSIHVSKCLHVPSDLVINILQPVNCQHSRTKKLLISSTLRPPSSDKQVVKGNFAGIISFTHLMYFSANVLNLSSNFRCNMHFYYITMMHFMCDSFLILFM